MHAVIRMTTHLLGSFVLLFCLALPVTGFRAASDEIDEVALVTRLLEANGADSLRAREVAPYVVRYAERAELDPLLVVGVIGVENHRLVPKARSHAGARGIMQIMPFWTKYYSSKCGMNLAADSVNVCYGTNILRANLDATGNLRSALLRYNGCVRSPGCTQYPTQVFARAGRAILAARGEHTR